MESSPTTQNNNSNPNSSLLPSPSNHSSNSSTSSSTSNLNGIPPKLHHHPPPQSPASRPIFRSDSANPYPTTFVQADSSSFKQVVQMLTGSPDSSPSPPQQPSKTHIPPIKSTSKKPHFGSGFKLYERRNTLKNLQINTLNSSIINSATGFSPRKPEILSPSILDFPSLALSPVTPLIRDPFDPSVVANRKGGNGNLDREAEERGIKEKGFYLHTSPSTTPMNSEPRLLPLFPVTSPRVTGSSSLDL